MTAQYGEDLRYKGNNYIMATEPFGIYLKKHKIGTRPFSTNNWRGYRGQWEIENEKLFLVDISARITTKRTRENPLGTLRVGLNYFFPGQEKVFAKWFSGEIRIPTGEMLKYIHMGYASIFEKELILGFKKGIMVSEKEIDNRGEFFRKGGPKNNMMRAAERLIKLSKGDDSGYKV